MLAVSNRKDMWEAVEKLQQNTEKNLKENVAQKWIELYIIEHWK